MEKHAHKARKLSNSLRKRLKDLKKSDEDLLLNLDEEELLDAYKVAQYTGRLFIHRVMSINESWSF